MAGIAVWDALQVILMLGLGFPEVTDGGQLGDHLARPKTGGFDIGDGVLGNPLLLVIGIEDRRSVACADIVALPVAGCRVVDLEEEFQNRAVIRTSRIVRLHRRRKDRKVPFEPRRPASIAVLEVAT